MTSDDVNKLDILIKQNRSFAVYRIPGEEDIHFLLQHSGPARRIYDIEDLNGQSGFVIAPYKISQTSPIVLIQPDRWDIPSGLSVEALSSDNNDPEIELSDRQKEDYYERFNTFITPIKEKRFKKLVLSRSTTIEREPSFSPAKAFSSACKRYTRSYVYLCHTPQCGTWIGSTPEMLLCGTGDIWNTVALAGTQQLQNGELPKTWDDKNLIEQMLVAYYIRTQLSSFGIHAVEKGPYTVRAGELAHLRSDYHFQLPDNNTLGSLLKLLHPTPAVSGLPKEEAFEFIKENEGYDRSYYSGFVGWLDPNGKSNLYVNLRCMHIHDKSLTLYAGGGLLTSSDVDQEWKETEDKLQTMLALIKLDNDVLK